MDDGETTSDDSILGLEVIVTLKRDNEKKEETTKVKIVKIVK